MNAADHPAAREAAAPLRIDFVSDVTCPWCAIGLASLEQAIARLGDAIAVDLQLQPFELNPGIARDGEPIADYAARKYGASAGQLAQRQAQVRGRAAEVGLAFADRSHVYATFDAHRLLHWAGGHGRALALEHALFTAYHGRGENPALPEVLLRAAIGSGLDPRGARAVIDSDVGADEVRATMRRWQQLGIDGVPAIVFDGRWLVQGCQTADFLEETLRRIAASRQASG